MADTSNNEVKTPATAEIVTPKESRNRQANGDGTKKFAEKARDEIGEGVLYKPTVDKSTKVSDNTQASVMPSKHQTSRKPFQNIWILNRHQLQKKTFHVDQTIKKTPVALLIKKRKIKMEF